MKDLTHYFNSPPPSLKKPESQNLADEEAPLVKKKVRKKRLKLDKLCSPEDEDEKNEVNCNAIENGGGGVVKQEESSGKKKKRKLPLDSADDGAERKTKRKVVKGRLKIVEAACLPPAIVNESFSPLEMEKTDRSHLAKEIIINSLVVEKLDLLLRDDYFEDDDDNVVVNDDDEENEKKDDSDDGENEKKDDSDDEDYVSCKKVKRKRKKRNSLRKTAASRNGPDGGCSENGDVTTPCRNGGDKSLVGGGGSSDKSADAESASEKRNSLFKYYSKVDKATLHSSNSAAEKIKVQALVHTPPSEKKRRSMESVVPTPNSKKSLRSKFNRLRSELMKASDAIEVISSEDIVQPPLAFELEVCGGKERLSGDQNGKCPTNAPIRLVRNGIDWKISYNSASPKSECIGNEETATIENEPIDTNPKTSLDTPKSDNLSSEKAHEEKKRIRQTFSDVMKKGEDSNESSKKRGKSIRSQSKHSTKTSPPGIDVDDSSNDSVCEVRTVRESTMNRSLNGSSKINFNEKSAGFMAKFLGRTLVNSPKETVKSEKIDPSLLIARQKFLKSGMPEEFRQKISSQSEETVLDPPPFPSVSHVQQRDPMRLIWNIPDPRLKLRPAPKADLEIVSDWSKFVVGNSILSEQLSSAAETPIRRIKSQKTAVKEFLKSKTGCEPSVNERWSALKKLKSQAVDSACWTDIYKPKSSLDILANKSCVDRFRLWLETYKNTAVKPKEDSEEDSSDEFVHSSDEDSALPKERVCVISGPIGCGKTSTVYAVANELGYKVLEVNASHNRNGKKVTTDLSEATQSHQVEHSNSLKQMFNNGRKVKKKKIKSKSNSNDVTSSSKKRSLILVEDADLLFEGFDEGFIPAIVSLSLTSKRPMVFTVNNNKAQHFTKIFKPTDLMLEFARPSSSNLATWLQLIAMAEGIQLDDKRAEDITHWTSNDVRRSLLQLQFLAQSCDSVAGWPCFVQRKKCPSAVMDKDGEGEGEGEGEKKEKSKSKSEMLSSLRSLASRSESLVINDLLMTSQPMTSRPVDPCPPPQACHCRESTSLVESADAAPSGGSLDNYCFAEHMLQHVTSCRTTVIRCPKKRWKADNSLKSGVATLARCAHASVYCDYLPALRFFARCESSRLASYTRRNRNFNYLQGLGINTDDGLTFDVFL